MFKDIDTIQFYDDSMLYKSFFTLNRKIQNKTKKKIKKKKQTCHLFNILIIVVSNKIVVKNKNETNMTKKKI